MFADASIRPDDVNFPRRIFFRPAEEARRRRLTEITGARVNLARLPRTIGEFELNARADRAAIAARTAQTDADRMTFRDTSVAKGERGLVVASYDEISPTIVIE